MRARRMVSYLACAAVFAVALAAAGYVRSTDWRTASREPVGLAPDPATTPEAIVQVYAARTIGWRGLFGVHTWVSTKPAGGGYTVYEVIGWRLRSAGSALVIRDRPPDGRWFGAEPELIADLRGPAAEPLVERIDKLARAYPWAGEYSVWPGPNSNTFTAWILRGVPELRADLPPTAIGKDYNGGTLVGTAPSGGGFQFSAIGLLGLTASGVEGLELNVLGLTFGINPFDPALKLPILGRLGPVREFTQAPAQSQ
ncbi:MAG TPA: DUF3750 domain-containing protein [Burkholderiales bacterium]|nr:DUF3750 domain-containing protein [Burkholderiales bacterium]